MEGNQDGAISDLFFSLCRLLFFPCSAVMHEETAAMAEERCLWGKRVSVLVFSIDQTACTAVQMRALLYKSSGILLKQCRHCWEFSCPALPNSFFVSFNDLIHWKQLCREQGCKKTKQKQIQKVQQNPVLLCVTVTALQSTWGSQFWMFRFPGWPRILW